MVVQAHAVFAADLSLALPDGTTLDAVNVATDTGIWQSVGHTVSDIPNLLTRLQGRIAEAYERIATIDRELVRLEHWDGQATYDAATRELSAINAAFAAAEEQADAEQGHAVPTADAATPSSSADIVPDAALPGALLALARVECAGAGWGEWQAMIPPAPASLAWMAAEVERLGTPCPRCPEPTTSEELDTKAPVRAGELRLSRSSSKAGVLFGDVPSQRRTSRTEANRSGNSEVEVHQLPLF